MAKSRLAAALVAVAVVAVLLARTLRLPRTYPPVLVCSCDATRNQTSHCHSLSLPGAYRLLHAECTGDGVGVAARLGACDDPDNKRQRSTTASLLCVAQSDGVWLYTCLNGVLAVTLS